ncbi:MAG: hypothetical protein VB124_05925, partial [Burkholderia sp.]
LLEAKNRELSQEPELLTGVLDWLLGINVNWSLARPIYATTPIIEAKRARACRAPLARRRDRSVCLPCCLRRWVQLVTAPRFAGSASAAYLASTPRV